MHDRALDSFLVIKTLAPSPSPLQIFKKHLLLPEQVVVQAMSDYPLRREIQKQGCSAIWTLALESSNRSFLGEAGANLAVIEALKAFPKDKHLIISGVVAIGYLAMDNENRELLNNAEACETLATCFQNFQDDKIVQQIGCVSTGVCLYRFICL